MTLGDPVTSEAPGVPLCPDALKKGVELEIGYGDVLDRTLGLVRGPVPEGSV